LHWGFRIEKATNEKGEEVPMDIFAYTDGLNMRPRPFECSIVPRSEEIRGRLIGKEARRWEI